MDCLEELIEQAEHLCFSLKEDDIRLDKLTSVEHDDDDSKPIIDNVASIFEQISANSFSDIKREYERKYLMEMQEENKELKEELNYYQTCLDVIMSRYRQQISQLTGLLVTIGGVPIVDNSNKCSNIISEHHGLIDRLKKMLIMIIRTDDLEITKQMEINTTLAAENAGLREILGIARRNDSVEMDARQD